MDVYKEPLKQWFSGYVREFRKKQRLSQEKMAELLHMTPRAYGDLERGKYCFSTQTLLFLFALLTEEEVVRIVNEFREITGSIERSKEQGKATGQNSGSKVISE